jgi:hypothetical protein
VADQPEPSYRNDWFEKSGQVTCTRKEVAMKGYLQIPLGATVRVKRQSGSFETYVFRGSDGKGPIYEDSQGSRHTHVGVYVEIAIKTSSGWCVL